MGFGAYDKVTDVKFDTNKLLVFHNYNETFNCVSDPMDMNEEAPYRYPTSLDVITYAVDRMPASKWYITKGTKSYCVFYLMLCDYENEQKFHLGRELCGIHMPTPSAKC